MNEFLPWPLAFGVRLLAYIRWLFWPLPSKHPQSVARLILARHGLHVLTIATKIISLLRSLKRNENSQCIVEFDPH
jgi:hypothetical protein